MQRNRTLCPILKSWLICFLLLCGTGNIWAGGPIQTYTEAGLGYPVPTPVDQQEALAGFRTYAALEARLETLAATVPHVTRSQVGTTRDGRPVWGFLISDADTNAPDGVPEGGAYIQGTLHAREWASPEIVTRLVEEFATDTDDAGLLAYLRDSLSIAVLPVANVDGFLQTQRTPAQYIGIADGRMRRKNMRDVDEILATTDDAHFGVDLNRNFSEGFGGGSASPSAESYRGQFPLSESVTQAALTAAQLRGTAPMRLHIDVHGAIPAIYQIRTGAAGRDAEIAALALKLQATVRAENGVSNSYQILDIPPTGYIGASDEYFAVNTGAASYTFEYPTPRYREGGSGPGFILPDDEMNRTWEESREALLLGLYWASAPPILERLSVWSDLNLDGSASANEIAYEATWGAGRTGPTITTGSLYTNRPTYCEMVFSKPMRRQIAGKAATWPGVGGALHPAASVSTNDGGSPVTLPISPYDSGWSEADASRFPALRYRYDTWVGQIALPEGSAGENASLSIGVTDLAGFQLDAMPQTIAAWGNGWLQYENSAGADGNGGSITIGAIPIVAAPETGDGLRIR